MHSPHACMPLHSLIANCWNMWLRDYDAGGPSLWLWRWLIASIFSTALQLHPRRVSTTRETKEMPCWSVYTYSSLSSSTLSAWSCIVAVPLAASFWSGEITVTSKATGLPRFQDWRYKSSGWDLAPGIRAGAFLLLGQQTRQLRTGHLSKSHVNEFIITIGFDGCGVQFVWGRYYSAQITQQCIDYSTCSLIGTCCL